MRLTRTERRWAHTIYDAMYPRNAHPALTAGAADADTEAQLDEIEKHWPAIGIFGLRLAYFMVWFAPIVLMFTWRTFGRLTRAQRVQLLERMAKNRIYPVRQMIVVLKATGALAYAALPQVREQVVPGRPVAGTAVWPLRRKESSHAA